MTADVMKITNHPDSPHDHDVTVFVPMDWLMQWIDREDIDGHEALEAAFESECRIEIDVLDDGIEVQVWR